MLLSCSRRRHKVGSTVSEKGIRANRRRSALSYTSTQSEEIIATTAIINIASAAIINIVITTIGKTVTTTSDQTVVVIATR